MSFNARSGVPTQRWCPRSARNSLLALLILLATSAAAGQDSPPLRDRGSILDSLVAAEQAQPGVGSSGSDILPPNTSRLSSEELARAYAGADALATYADWGLSHRVRVFEWQFQSSRIIFFTVLFLVMAGVVFSGIQFWRSIKEAGGRVQEGGAAEGPVVADVRVPGTTSHLEISTGGLKISSPVLGVIILGLSLAFFYLYLIYVYPIGETF